MGLQDRDYVKGGGNDRQAPNWNIKPEPIELNSYRSRKSLHSTEAAPMWLHITIGIVVAAAIM